MANPNPDISGLTPFQPGQSGNPGGKTAKQRQLEVEAAEMAAALRHKMLVDLTTLVGTASSVEQIKAEVLKLIKDSEDRAFGAPRQMTEIGGEGGGPVQHSLTIGFRSPD